jgi:ribonucleoside-diphosphate reductase alpha chain
MWMEVTGETDLTKSPWHGHTASAIDWPMRVRLQAAAQRHVDHSISSTLNLPSDVTVEQVDEIYRTAWKAGCKGVTIYRDGCRTGVLVKKEDKKADVNRISKTNAPKRPNTLPCDVHHIRAKGEEYFVLVGLLNDGDPFEVFAGKNGMIGKAVKTGSLTKMARGKYHAVFDDGSELKDVVDHISDEEEAITRLTSMALRHGADIEYAVHQLEKTRGDMLGFAKAMARALKKYIKDGTVVKGEECGECGGKLIRQDGCSKCLNCGSSKCN